MKPIFVHNNGLYLELLLSYKLKNFSYVLSRIILLKRYIIKSG